MGEIIIVVVALFVWVLVAVGSTMKDKRGDL